MAVVLCDLDGTLAKYEGWKEGNIGDPIPGMVNRIKAHILAGDEVRIFTARVGEYPGMSSQIIDMIEQERKKVEDWTEEHIGVRLAVTCKKDFSVSVIYDDRARQVEANTGRVIGEELVSNG